MFSINKIRTHLVFPVFFHQIVCKISLKRALPSIVCRHQEGNFTISKPNMIDRCTPLDMSQRNQLFLEIILTKELFVKNLCKSTAVSKTPSDPPRLIQSLP